MKFIFVIFALSCALNVTSFEVVERCKIDDEECLLKAANELITKHQNGNPEIGFPAIDPMLLTLRVVQKMNSVDIDGGIENATMTGVSKAKFSRFLISPDGKIELRFLIPLAIVEGPYDVEGQLIKMKIRGKGKIKTTFKNFEFLLKFQLENFTKEEDGKIYYRAIKPWMTFYFTGGSTHLSHLGSIANSLINWSFAVILNAVKDTVCVPFSKFYVSKINEVLNTIPIDELFLE